MRYISQCTTTIFPYNSTNEKMRYIPSNRNRANTDLILLSKICPKDKEIKDTDKNMLTQRQFPNTFKFGTTLGIPANEKDWNNILSKENIQLMMDIELNFCHLQMEWSENLSSRKKSFKNNSKQPINQLIEELSNTNISAMITIFHQDIPRVFESLGGWTNHIIVDYFIEYANFLFETYGKRVKYWITFNEPEKFCRLKYKKRSQDTLSEIGFYLCIRHVLLAHAKVYKLYKSKFYQKYNGEIGITLNGEWEWTKNITEMTMFGNPIFGSIRNYASLIKEIENKTQVSLPSLKPDEINMIQGSADFLGLNYQIQATEESMGLKVNESVESELNWLDYSKKLKKHIRWINKHFGNPRIFINENSLLNDQKHRNNLVRSQLNIILDLILENECHIKGYAYGNFLHSFKRIMPKTGQLVIANSFAKFYRNLIVSRNIPKLYPAEYDVPTQFPKEFIFGAASSAYQIEGAWNLDGKGPSIWDHFVHHHLNLIYDGTNGDVAANSYELYTEDVRILKELGVDFYRFSISWPRILPNGDLSVINEPGLQYYDKLINTLIRENIEPVITIYHWDLPQSLQEIGGWVNRTIVDHFEKYATLLFDRFADKVKSWISFNEPYIFCVFGLDENIMAPLTTSKGSDVYLCGHHVLLANARIYQIYRQKYYFKINSLGISLNIPSLWPKDPTNSNDLTASERSFQFFAGWFAHPIFSETGDYPEIMKNIIDNNSQMEGRTISRLPKFTDEEKELIKGSSDFFGLNYYFCRYVETAHENEYSHPSYLADQNVHFSIDNSWPKAASSWHRGISDGLRNVLRQIKSEYNNPPVLITENGWSDHGKLDDKDRIKYIADHLGSTLDAIWKDGSNVRGYTYWSLLDNFEWNAGYTERFGLYHVNFNSSYKERTPKKSSFFYRDAIKIRQIPL